MKCYNHKDVEAIGVCTSCGKAICAECSMEINKKILCKSCIQDKLESHENHVQTKANGNNVISKIIYYLGIIIDLIIIIPLFIVSIALSMIGSRWWIIPFAVFVLTLPPLVYDVYKKDIKQSKMGLGIPIIAYIVLIVLTFMSMASEYYGILFVIDILFTLAIWYFCQKAHEDIATNKKSKHI